MANVQIDLDSTDAKDLFAKGRKALVLRQFKTASEALSRAAQLTALEVGDKHDSLGEIYFSYGKALLELSREESDALGDAAIKSESEDEDSEAEDEEAPEPEKPSENGGEKKENGKKVAGEESKDTKDEANEINQKDEKDEKDVKNEKDEKVEEASSEDTASAAAPQAVNGAEPTPGTSAAEPDEPEEDLQLAWEVLEIAKEIFEARGEGGRERVAETLITLGEVSTENEMFDNAIADIQAGLEIQKELFGTASRKVAETVYKLGIVHTNGSHFDEAVEDFKQAITSIRQCIEKLEKEDDKDEVDELKSLIPEIEEKISDTISAKAEAIKAIQETLCAPKSETANAETAASGSKEPMNISHLVKRKRKTEEEAEVESPAKKTAQ